MIRRPGGEYRKTLLASMLVTGIFIGYVSNRPTIASDSSRLATVRIPLRWFIHQKAEELKREIERVSKEKLPPLFQGKYLSLAKRIYDNARIRGQYVGLAVLELIGGQNRYIELATATEIQGKWVKVTTVQPPRIQPGAVAGSFDFPLFGPILRKLSLPVAWSVSAELRGEQIIRKPNGEDIVHTMVNLRIKYSFAGISRTINVSPEYRFVIPSRNDLKHPVDLPVYRGERVEYIKIPPEYRLPGGGRAPSRPSLEPADARSGPTGGETIWPGHDFVF